MQESRRLVAASGTESGDENSVWVTLVYLGLEAGASDHSMVGLGTALTGGPMTDKTTHGVYTRKKAKCDELIGRKLSMDSKAKTSLSWATLGALFLQPII